MIAYFIFYYLSFFVPFGNLSPEGNVLVSVKACTEEVMLNTQTNIKTTIVHVSENETISNCVLSMDVE